MSAAVAIKGAVAHRVRLRGIEHHVQAWGDPRAPKLFLLHGWMDVGPSFQFLVDALRKEWYAIAPDLRGFGRSAWPEQGYWFTDYLADLEALIDSIAPGESVRLVGHSLGGNIAMTYAGVRPARVRALVSLEGFGIPGEDSSQAPRKLAAWLDALADPPTFSPYANMDAVAARLRKTNPRLSAGKARFLAEHWAEAVPGSGVRLRSDPRHKLPFPIVYRLAEVFAIWKEITAPVLWIAAADSHIPRWLDANPEGEGAVDSLREVRRRISEVPNARLEVVTDAGHMLHHDQPAAVAAAIEGFLPR